MPYLRTLNLFEGGQNYGGRKPGSDRENPRPSAGCYPRTVHIKYFDCYKKQLMNNFWYCTGLQADNLSFYLGSKGRYIDKSQANWRTDQSQSPLNWHSSLYMYIRILFLTVCIYEGQDRASYKLWHTLQMYFFNQQIHSLSVRYNNNCNIPFPAQFGHISLSRR